MHISHKLHTLSNGLRLLVHTDHTSPIVSSQLVVHVGSARETHGHTGFAHYFEHMMFQGSGQVPEGQYFQRVQAAGGSLNANTSADRTLYFEEMPSDRIELALWLESDRLGWLLQALDQKTLDNQRDVVLEERKQSYEQKPYGNIYEVLSALAHPREHPYSWMTIGSAEDVRAATLADVTNFFRQWYVPNNATLALGGDIEFDHAVELVERHYGPIPTGAPTPPADAQPFAIDAERRVYMEDRVPVPQLNLAYPTVHAGHADAPALDLLLQVLSANRSSVLDRAMTVDEHLASRLLAGHNARELAGMMTFSMRPHDGIHLDALHARLIELLAETAERGVTQAELDRVRASHEADLVRGLEKVAARASVLALNDRMRGDPDALEHDAEARARVTPAEVTDVLRRYLVDRPFAAVSTVPQGNAESALADSTPAGTESAPAPRAAEPSFGEWTAPPIGTHVEPHFDSEPPPPQLPASWSGEAVPGCSITSAPGGPLPLVRVRVAVPCGRMYQGTGNFGLASMTATLLREGSGKLGGHEFQEALDTIGAHISTGAREDELVLDLDVLEEHVARGLEIFGDVLHAPMLHAGDFERLRAERLQTLAARAANPNTVADDLWRGIIHGQDSARGGPLFGSPETIAAMRVEEARELWHDQAGPGGARILHAGCLDESALRSALGDLLAPWSMEGRETRSIETSDAPAPATATRAWLREVPGAKQCELRIGHRALRYLDPDYQPLAIWNHAFGGHFSSRMNMRLREELGLTYGARSSLSGGRREGAWTASTAVRAEAGAQAVLETLSLFRAQLADGVREEELAFAKDSLGKADARRFETLGARLAYLDEWTRYELGPDFPIAKRERRDAFTTDDLDTAARQHLDASRLEILVVGETRDTRRELEAAGIECHEC